LGSVAVNGGVEGSVVVHLELAVELEAAGGSQGFAPQDVEAMGEISALFFKDRKTGTVARRMIWGRIGAFGFFACVVDLEREDGEPVDDEARGFGVERSTLIGEVLRTKPIKEGAVKLFGKIVAELIGTVDAAFYVGQSGIAGARCAGFVFNVPEVEVGAMLTSDEGSPGIGSAVRSVRHPMPFSG